MKTIMLIVQLAFGFGLFLCAVLPPNRTAAASMPTAVTTTAKQAAITATVGHSPGNRSPRRMRCGESLASEKPGSSGAAKTNGKQ